MNDAQGILFTKAQARADSAVRSEVENFQGQWSDVLLAEQAVLDILKQYKVPSLLVLGFASIDSLEQNRKDDLYVSVKCEKCPVEVALFLTDVITNRVPRCEKHQAINPNDPSTYV